jgi:hypothetical protein
MEKFQFYSYATGEEAASTCYPMDSTSVCTGSPALTFGFKHIDVATAWPASGRPGLIEDLKNMRYFEG